MLDDIALHRRQQPQELIGGARIDAPLPQNSPQRVDHSVELRLGYAVPRVHLFH
jgi:hypothetical protein